MVIVEVALHAVKQRGGKWAINVGFVVGMILTAIMCDLIFICSVKWYTCTYVV